MAKRDEGKPYQDERPKPGSSLASVFIGCVLGVGFPIVAAYALGFLILALDQPPDKRMSNSVFYGIIFMADIAAYFLIRTANRTAAGAFLMVAASITASTMYFMTSVH